jgi:hypothetical protein
MGGNDQETVVTITLKELDNTSTNIEVNESDLKEDDPEIINKMIDQKDPFSFFDTGKSRIFRELFVELGRAATMALFVFFSIF